MPTLTPTPAAALTGARLIPDRSIYFAGATRGSLRSDLRLETVRDTLRSMNERQRPLDHQRSPGTVLLDYGDGRGPLLARFLSPNGATESYRVSRTAYAQLTGEVLPARGGGFLSDLADVDGASAKLATMAYAKFAGTYADPRLFRTFTTRIDGEAVPVLRSVHSTSYAAYDNLRFVEDLLTNMEVRDLPVLQAHITDGAMRIRFGLHPVERIELRTPTPMVEAWNSEVGRKATGLQGGIFRLVCTNGAHTWEAGASYRWRHYGDADRIAGGVAGAVAEIRAYTDGTVDAYRKALDVAIDDAYALLEAELSRAGFSASTVAAAGVALDDPTTTPGRNLASAVDAVTLIAQNDGDLITAAELERFGGDLLRRGLTMAERGAIRVRA
jgi:hypothetical protein